MRSKILILISALFVLTGCVSSMEKKVAKAALETEAHQANKILAGKYVDALTLCTSCEFDGLNVIYNYELDEDMVSLGDIDKSILENNILETWKTNPAVRAVKQNLNILDGSVIYNYTGSKTKETFTIKVKPPKDSEEEEEE